MSESLVECLPADLRAGATITKIVAGLSGAGVYRVVASGQVYVLKVAADEEPLETWQGRLTVQTVASDAKLTATIVHSDPERRAIVSALIEDKSFRVRFWTPQTRTTALIELGELLRRVHALPVPPGTVAVVTREVFARVWSQVESFAMPPFARTAIERALVEQPPPCGRALVLSHNDVNPSNLIWDGEQLRLLDWDSASVNDPLYDLATISVFLRMDDATCAELLAIHDQASPSPLPARFLYNRRVMSAFIGTVFLRLARAGGHAGESDAAPVTLEETYQAMREGRLNPQTAEGQWQLGLAMLHTSGTL